MSWNLKGTHAEAGDLVELLSLRHKHYIFTLARGGELQTHRGVIKHDDMIGKLWGSQIFSHLGVSFFMLQPALGNILRDTERNTQIMYPKDIGFLLVTMGIGPGQHVLEAGTGSGALTRALAFAVGPEGRVTSYEFRPEMQRLAKKNLERLGLAARVDFKLRDIGEGFDEIGVDALFLDVQNPYDYVHHARAALKPGGFFGSILPTSNQVARLIQALRQFDFAFIDMVEVLLRYYKAEPNRLRPTDRMVAHTGYLVFARPVLLAETEDGHNELYEEQGLRDDEAGNLEQI